MAADPTPRKSRPTTITLTDDLHAGIQAIAERRLTSVSHVILELVQEGVEREKREETASAR